MTKRNFDCNIKDLDGSDVLEKKKLPDGTEASGPGTAISMKSIVTSALLAPDDATGLKKAERYAMAVRLQKGGDIDFTVDELSEIKELVGKFFPPLTVGQIYALIEKEPVEQKK